MTNVQNADFATESRAAETEIPPPARPVPLLLSLADAVALNAPRSPVPTGIKVLDDLLGGGIARDEAIVVGGGPGSFKTSLACFIVPNLATPATAVLVIAADEPPNRVARKIGTQYGERWAELTSDYPPVIERLRGKTGDSFIRITHPRAVFALEDVLDAFDREAPKELHRIVILDHLHSVVSRDGGADETEKAVIERTVNVLIEGYVRAKGWSLIALSEVTKAALSPEAASNPMMAFAGTRKIVSRFDAGLLLIPDEGLRVRHLWAKNRFGLKTPFTLSWDTERWVPLKIPKDFIQEQKTAKKEEKRSKEEAADDEAVLSAVRKAPVPIKKSELSDRVKIQKKRASAALARLIEAGTLTTEQGPRNPGGGPRPDVIREVFQ